MRLLLDECLPRKFKNTLVGHDCRTVPEEGWAGRQNGELLSLAEKSGFEVFVTLDRGVEYEQNLRGRVIAVVLIRAQSNRLADLLPRSPEILQAIRSIQPGDLVKIG
jgi:hypothetical protein